MFTKVVKRIISALAFSVAVWFIIWGVWFVVSKSFLDSMADECFKIVDSLEKYIIKK